MKLTEIILLKSSHNFNHPDNPKPYYSVSEKPISDLIDALKRNQVEIDLLCSERKITYSIKTNSKKINSEEYAERSLTLPLTHDFPDSTLTALYLRDGNGLELNIEDYCDKPKQIPYFWGADAYGNLGIKCELIKDGETVDISLITNVKNALVEIYFKPLQKNHPITPMSPEQQENRNKYLKDLGISFLDEPASDK